MVCQSCELVYQRLLSKAVSVHTRDRAAVVRVQEPATRDEIDATKRTKGPFYRRPPFTWTKAYLSAHLALATTGGTQLAL